MIDCERVGGIGIYASEYAYGVLFYAKEVRELDEFLLKLAEYVPAGSFRRRDVTIRIWWTSFRTKFLVGNKVGVSALGWQAKYRLTKTDAIDRRIIKQIVAEPELSNRQLAELLKMPRATFDARLRGLEERGVIVGRAYWINTFDLGFQAYRLLIFGSLREKDLRAVYRFAEQHPNIVGFSRCLGPWECELRVEVDKASVAEEISNEIQSRYSESVHDVRVLPYIRNLKTSFLPFQHESPTQ